jgi:hypothetical protein
LILCQTVFAIGEGKQKMECFESRSVVLTASAFND